MTNLVIQDGIGYIQTGNQLVSATPAEYVAEIERLSSALRTANANHERFEREWYLRGDEIERLQRDLAAARLLLDERIALVHPLTDEPAGEQQTIEGECGNCHRLWKVTAPTGAAVSVLAVNCVCGHVQR